MCACADRRAALLAAARAAAKGDVGTLKTEATFVVSSAVFDAGAVAKAALRASRARLAR